MTASQRAKQKCASKQNQPAKTSEAANCCCMIAPWIVVEDGRSYQLKVTKTKEQEIMGETKTVPDSEVPSNKEKNSYELHIVAPPADKDGKVTYKKITSKHKFLKKECDLKMLVKSGKQEKSISEGGSFEIDTNGNIKGAMEQKCEKEVFKSKVNPTDYKTLAGYMKALQEETSPEDMAKEIEIYLKTIEAQEIEASEEKTDMEIVLGALFNPKSIAKEIELKPDGSKKCVSQPKVHLFAYPYTKADGSFSFMYTKANKTMVPDYKGQIEINRAKITVSGSLNMYYGARIITLGAATEVGGGSYIRKRKKQLGERRPGKNIFTMMEGILNVFKKAEDAQQKRNRKVNIYKSRKHQVFKFDPGKTGFSVTSKKHELKEIPSKYTIDYSSDINLTINILSGVSITVDCIELLILTARALNPAVSKILSEARDKGEKGFGWEKANLKVGANVELSINGGAVAGLAWKKELEKDIEITQAKLAGTIGLKAKANVFLEGKILFVSVHGYMGGVAASAIKATTPSQFVLKGQIKSENNHILLGGGADFTGLALYYVYGGSIEIKDEASSKGNGGGVFDGETTGHKETLSKDVYSKNPPLTIAKPWPTDEKDAFIDMEQFLN